MARGDIGLLFLPDVTGGEVLSDVSVLPRSSGPHGFHCPEPMGATLPPAVKTPLEKSPGCGVPIFLRRISWSPSHFLTGIKSCSLAMDMVDRWIIDQSSLPTHLMHYAQSITCWLSRWWHIWTLCTAPFPSLNQMDFQSNEV